MQTKENIQREGRIQLGKKYRGGDRVNGVNI